LFPNVWKIPTGGRDLAQRCNDTGVALLCAFVKLFLFGIFGAIVKFDLEKSIFFSSFILEIRG
jgi:hypothetical protein